jgi:hypothetical protein
MEFDTDSDPDFLYELFGEDVNSLAESVQSSLLPSSQPLTSPPQGSCLGIRSRTTSGSRSLEHSHE